MGPIRRLLIASPISFNSSSSTTMDYLTILATRSLVLFENSGPASSLTSAASTPMSSPSSSILGLTPPPISLPLLSLMRDDAHCANFLSNHVLEYSGAGRDTDAATRASHDSMTHKAMLQEAEVLAWQQICRAKSFAQDLGRHYGAVDAVHEDELAALAANHGLGLAPPSVNRRRDRSSEQPKVAPTVADTPAILA